MKSKIDTARCYRGMRSIYVNGDPSPNRKYLIELAIKELQTKGKDSFSTSYFGIKNYASFGDQRADCTYGMVPSHGSIVFSIGRIREVNDPIIRDEIYLLECVRDFGSVSIPNHPKNSTSSYYKDPELNLIDVLKYTRDLQNKLNYLIGVLDKSEVDSIQLEFDNASD